MMELAMSRDGIRSLLHRQLSALYPVDGDEERAIDDSLDEALARCERSFSRNRNKYYRGGRGVRFDPLHGCQWAAFLYYLSNSIWRSGGGVL